jgi:hypothetical protein
MFGGAGPAESMAGETSSRPTIAGFEISTRAKPGISASSKILIDLLTFQRNKTLITNLQINVVN